MNGEGKWNSSIVFFSTPNFDLNVLFRAFRDLWILRGENHMFGHCFRIFCMYQSSYKQDRVFLHSWWDPWQIDHKVFKKE